MHAVPKMLLHFLSMMMFAMLYSYTSFCVYFISMFMFNCLLNNVKAETDEIKQ